MRACFTRRLHKKLAIFISLVTVILFLVACISGSLFNSPDAKAIAFVKAIYEEHNPQKAIDMVCPGSQLITISSEEIMYSAKLSLEGKQLSVDKSSSFWNNYAKQLATPLTAADQANGITGRAGFNIQYIYRNSGDVQWSDGNIIVDSTEKTRK